MFGGGDSIRSTPDIVRDSLGILDTGDVGGGGLEMAVGPEIDRALNLDFIQLTDSCFQVWGLAAGDQLLSGFVNSLGILEPFFGIALRKIISSLVTDITLGIDGVFVG